MSIDGKRVLPRLLYKKSLHCLPPFFQILYNPVFPCQVQTPTPLLFHLPCFFGSVGDQWVLFYLTHSTPLETLVDTLILPNY